MPSFKKCLNAKKNASIFTKCWESCLENYFVHIENFQLKYNQTNEKKMLMFYSNGLNIFLFFFLVCALCIQVSTHGVCYNNGVYFSDCDHLLTFIRMVCWSHRMATPHSTQMECIHTSQPANQSIPLELCKDTSFSCSTKCIHTLILIDSLSLEPYTLYWLFYGLTMLSTYYCVRCLVLFFCIIIISVPIKQVFYNFVRLFFGSLLFLCLRILLSIFLRFFFLNILYIIACRCRHHRWKTILTVSRVQAYICSKRRLPQYTASIHWILPYKLLRKKKWLSLLASLA